MPEGDTIHRAARTLRSVLVGQPVTRFVAPRLPERGPQPGTAVNSVEARGKHLLVAFDDGSVLLTHLRMTGSWHTYPPGATWQRPASQARVTIETPRAVAVCFRAPVVELVAADRLDRHPALARLGPDLLGDDPDLDEVLGRIATVAEPDAPIADVLLDQRVAAGIGNVYKSELCFLAGLDPRTPAAAVDATTRRHLYERAIELLTRNLDARSRTTVRGARDGALYVYGRAGRPCRRCRTPIRADREGVHARVTYWCPGCQPPHVRA